MIGGRPFSAKEAKAGSRSLNRVGSRRRRTRAAAQKSGKQRNGTLYDREQLYEEAQSYKLEAAELQKENALLKTKIKNLENRAKKKIGEERSANPKTNLISNLK
jgi:hypothetical protein